MSATNAPSYPAQANSGQLAAEQKAHEPSMDDILASICRIISDDDALPLSRRARAAAAKPAISSAPDAAAPLPQTAPVAPSSDAFFGLGHRLGRDVEAPVEPAAAPVEPAAPVELAAPAAEPQAIAQETRAPKSPPLKFRDLALKNFSVRPAPEPQVAAAPAEAQTAPVAPQAPAAVLAPAAELAPAPEPDAPAVESVSAEPEPFVLRPSLQDAPEPVAPPKASVVSLAPRLASFSEARLKIAPLNFRTPLFRAPPRPPEPAEETERQTPAEAEPAAPLPAAPAAAVPQNPVEPASGAPTHPSAERLAPILAEAERTETRERQFFQQEPAREPAPNRAQAGDPGLLSPMTGAKINASFEALTESLMSRDPDLVERLAREMLRPMLKSWLEDNLPIVVERLVRAEIERVARGR